MPNRRQIVASAAALGITAALGRAETGSVPARREIPEDAPRWIALGLRDGNEYGEIFELVDGAWVTMALDKDCNPIPSGRSIENVRLYRFWKSRSDMQQFALEYARNDPEEERTIRPQMYYDWNVNGRV